MSQNNQTTTSGGIGFFGLLAIVFIVLKLAGYITWSWEIRNEIKERCEE